MKTFLFSIIRVFLLLLFFYAGCEKKILQNDYPITPVPFNQVIIKDGFWKKRMEVNRTVTIPFAFQKCDETGRISNFEIAGRLKNGEFEGIFYNDSDVYKIIEGASYSLIIHPDKSLESYLDELIAKIAAAQEEDGYLYTIRSINPNHEQLRGAQRWEDLKRLHELYNVGHLYEAAVAYYQATGKRSLLDVAVKNAELITSVFGPGKNQGVPGHQEIEIGLVKLYRITGIQKYLDLAKFFTDQRGNSTGHELFGEYAQDHLPVTEQNEAVGHAVRAGYLYSGMADVAAIKKDTAYIKAIEKIWNDIVSKKMYITGGVGSSPSGEKFGDAYDLPNKTAYNETCASIAQLLFNHRLFLLHGNGKYMDVFERILYNGFLAGVSLEGDKFFYPNPLESDGEYPFNHGYATRSPWFKTSCCPANIVRVMPSLGNYIYAHSGDSLFINLYLNNSAEFLLHTNKIKISQETNYPWEGRVSLDINVTKPTRFTLLLRVPGWTQNQPIPADLYQYIDQNSESVIIKINDTPQNFKTNNGYGVLEKIWKNGDKIDLDLPLPVRRIISNNKVKENIGKVTLERGPLVYCAEGIDNNGKVFNLEIEDSLVFRVVPKNNLLGGINLLQSKKICMIPYYAWSHRGEGEMAVWLKRKIDN